jgi:phosphoribosyl 1,2-cyclic phosphodiesterase
MYIKCWGARGGIPVSGPEYLVYGGDTPCLEIRDDAGTTIIVDSGTGIRRLGTKLVREERFDLNIIFSHSHWDHIIGFPFFKPVYDPRFKINILGSPRWQGNMDKLIKDTFKAPHFPVQPNQIKAQMEYCEVGGKFTLGEIIIETIPLSHPNLGLGFKFVHKGKVFVFLTDNELGFVHRGGKTFSDYMRFCQGADILIHDAEYTDEEYLHTKTWGHSRYTDALRLALEAGVKTLGLFHHNQDRTDSAIETIVADVARLIKQSVRQMQCFAVKQGQEIILDIE